MLRHRLAFRIELEVPGDTNMSKERVSVAEVSSECCEEVAAGAGCGSGNGQSSGPGGGALMGAATSEESKATRTEPRQ